MADVTGTPVSHHHRVGERSRTVRRRAATEARTEKIRVRIREEKGKKDLKNPNPNPRRKLGEEQEKRTEHFLSDLNREGVP